MLTQHNRWQFLMAAVVLLLMIPFVAMQVTKEVNWSAFDFVLAALLLSSVAFAIELVLRKFKSVKQRILICVGILLVLFVVWAELAVGIFGSPIAGS